MKFFFTGDVDDNVNIFLGKPGSGKSAFCCYLAERYSADQNLIMITDEEICQRASKLASIMSSFEELPVIANKSFSLEIDIFREIGKHKRRTFDLIGKFNALAAGEKSVLGIASFLADRQKKNVKGLIITDSIFVGLDRELSQGLFDYLLPLPGQKFLVESSRCKFPLNAGSRFILEKREDGVNISGSPRSQVT